MAKHIYHIPLHNTLQFIKKYKTELRKFTTDKKELEYYKLLGKSYYLLQTEEFVRFFKIDKDLSYALKTVEYFNSIKFIDKVCSSLNFSQFYLEDNKLNPKDFFYAFCYIYAKESNEDFVLFMQKTFLHYHTAFNKTTNINIDHKEMCYTLAKSKKIILKESFGENEKSSFFKILVDDKVVVDEKGKLIKTLRKKAYKNLFYYLIDLDASVRKDKDVAHEMMQALSAL